ncbi:hypothetical protein JAO29_09950 [Edaphobacter sp. HDX4]|uniref:hypothetical protein n=1 Tax=Edaphobacter sp. HDX4 TaxID=2794064 RepID=UPI002FE5C06E
MARGQGYAAVGAVLLAGLAFRGSLSPGTSPILDKSHEVQASVEKSRAEEGPWTASCRYWAAVRPFAPQPQPIAASAAAPQVDIKLTRTHPGFAATVATMTDPADTSVECGPDIQRWGIPDRALAAKPEIHAIVAAISDPVHGHLALEFDRTADSLLQAAADNHYLSSMYWLPWRGASSSAPLTSQTAAEQATERKRQRQPGLIILKYSPPENEIEEPDVGESSFYRVIYLFLVAESPALGMDGTQLHNALAYEKALRANYGASLSMEKSGDTIAVIGPHFSGSATSLRQALLSALHLQPQADLKPGTNVPSPVPHTTRAIAAGTSSTEVSARELNTGSDNINPITYISFGEDTRFEERQLTKPIFRSNATAILVEDDSTFGAATVFAKRSMLLSPEYIRFPRDISLLRNAQGDQGSSPQPATPVPSPYLNLSLKDPGVDDTIPKFSTVQTALSQEAQLMAIERRLQKEHIRYILISASNTLDEIFLAKELHRACPNATITFYGGGDLLVERDVDNAPYIGSITVTPYSLLPFDTSTLPSQRFFADSRATAFYNAASYIFWWGSKASADKQLPKLAGSYKADGRLRFPLLATAVGADGYYPLGILSPCAGETRAILPDIGIPGNDGNQTACDPTKDSTMTDSDVDKFLPSRKPSMFWYLLCICLAALCLTHAASLYSANYWSPSTRDLAIMQNDQPRRRTVYINIGTSMLVSMALALTIPWFSFAWKTGWYILASLVACAALLSALIAATVTFAKTKGYRSLNAATMPGDQIRLYPWFNRMAAASVVVVLVLMGWMCLYDPASPRNSHVNLFFSYRCLYPLGGVSPVVPVLLLLLAWYLWAMFQTARLRFSAMNRPRLPGLVHSTSVYPLYVADTKLGNCKPPLACCLFENIDCLLITRTLASRVTRPAVAYWLWPLAKSCQGSSNQWFRTLGRHFTKAVGRYHGGILNWILTLFYCILFTVCAFGLHIQSLDRFLYPARFTAYEMLISILFYPLVMIALAGWLRVILVWAALKHGLLEQLERSPFRLAFSRLSDVDWVTMLSQSGLSIRWRDMARSTESLRQLMNNCEMKKAAGSGWADLMIASDSLNDQISDLLQSIGGAAKPGAPQQCIGRDLPHAASRRELCCIYAMERGYATFCEKLLEYILIPYWNKERIGFVSELDIDSKDGKHIADAPEEPLHIRLAEEFLAIRYVALIRTVLVNIRHLMVFVSAAFVLAIVAWNSYPFQPRQLIDWCLTILMLGLSAGFIWVFAQMHRDPILSRITSTTPNQLGSDFYIRLVTFGAVPVLTWLAYQFPEIGGSILRMLQPSLQIAK